MSLISQEIENVQKLNEEIVAAVEDENEKNMENKFREKPSLLSTTLNNSLMSDETVYNEPSTSQQQQIDPFAQAKSNAIADPFAQVDPFANQGSFAAAFPSDPFAQGFPADAGFESTNANINKPPPPRPAPPKSSRTTPVNNDPFAPSQGAVQQTANFANFADFGSAFN
ncbi:unnamed protein product [Caenorhabditis angaria]|uniref:Uncharacterized protein n=1 Tax=Caenorhabditis angaria TaxID=860376 RepID=A0A9P1IBA0_9PELO|nr:unnamed protein product [Caenorhabditis angaria]